MLGTLAKNGSNFFAFLPHPVFAGFKTLHEEGGDSHPFFIARTLMVGIARGAPVSQRAQYSPRVISL
jgi:hypothetical protein